MTRSDQLLFFQINGEDQLVLEERFLFHISLPVAVSNAATNEFLSLSHCRYNLSSRNVSELPVPNPLPLGKVPTLAAQTNWPSRSTDATLPIAAK